MFTVEEFRTVGRRFLQYMTEFNKNPETFESDQDLFNLIDEVHRKLFNAVKHKRLASKQNGTSANDINHNVEDAVSNEKSPDKTLVAEGTANMDEQQTEKKKSTRTSTPSQLSKRQQTFRYSDLSKLMSDMSTIDISLLDNNTTAIERTLLAMDTNAVNRYEAICENIKELMPKCNVHIYGSHLYELGDESSDLNLYIESENQYNCSVRKGKMRELQNELKEALDNNPTEWKQTVCVNRTVLYPLIKAVNVKTGLSCTFSFANGLFVEANKRLMEYMDVVPLIRHFVIFLRKWQSRFTEFHFSTYQLTVLVLWYLQYRNYVPSVRSLQITRKKIICGSTQVNFIEPPTILKPMRGSVSIYMHDFFEIMGRQFVPERDIICPYYGKLFRRYLEDGLDADNIKLIKFIDGAKSGLWDPPRAVMYVHDIFLQNWCPNITASISSAAVSAFQEQSRLMADVLNEFE